VLHGIVNTYLWIIPIANTSEDAYFCDN
jgi:hypothetical protein